MDEESQLINRRNFENKFVEGRGFRRVAQPQKISALALRVIRLDLGVLLYAV